MKKRLIRILIAASLFVVLFIVDQLLDLTQVFGGTFGFLLPFTLYFVIYCLVGYDVLWKAVRNIGHGQIFDENFLMMVATVGAFALGIYRGVNGLPVEGFDEACAVLLFYQIGEWFQKYATGKSRRSIAALMDLRPDYANVQIDGVWQKVDPATVTVGSLIQINPGEKIPLDAVVVAGTTNLDTKALTGEALPRAVTVNDTVLSGCVNLTTQITARVTKAFYDSTVNKILDLVDNAAMKKSRSENFITKFARVYTPLVVIIAALLVLVPGLITGAWTDWLYRALSFLVVSCPCALVISVPMSFFVSLGVASKNGILVKGSNYFEKLNQANIFVFDKTGTLTKGNFAITKVVPNEQRLTILRLAAIAEQNSSHPIAQSIIAAYGEKVPGGYTLTNVAGAGVMAVKGDETIYCGNAKLLREHQIAFNELNEVGTVVYVARNGQYIGALLIQDEIRPEAATVVSQLTAAQAQTLMLTGDNATVAGDIAERIGLSSYQASLLPQDKVGALEQIMQEKDAHDVVCFVGDGINDAPVLTRADVGIAMGGVGSDAAIEAADVVLMHDDLNSITAAKRLARRTMRVVRQNIIFSLLIKVGILVCSACGLTNMWFAVFGDVGVAILAILNALRLNRFLC